MHQYTSYVQVQTRLGNQQVAQDPIHKLSSTNTFDTYKLKLA